MHHLYLNLRVFSHGIHSFVYNSMKQILEVHHTYLTILGHKYTIFIGVQVKIFYKNYGLCIQKKIVNGTMTDYTFENETWTMIDIKIYAHKNLHKLHHFSVGHLLGSSYNLIYWRSLNGQIRLTHEDNILFQVVSLLLHFHDRMQNPTSFCTYCSTWNTSFDRLNNSIKFIFTFSVHT